MDQFQVYYKVYGKDGGQGTKRKASPTTFSPKKAKVSDDVETYPSLPTVTWDRLQLIKEIGAGDYGTTSLYNLTLENGDITEVAVKVLHNDTPVTCEARVLYELAGAGGAPLLYGITSDPPAIVMEFIHGVPFSAVDQKEDAYEATVDAVYEFHAAGFCHLDIHPGNIIVDTSTSPYTAHLIDVGGSEKIPADTTDANDLKEMDWTCISIIYDDIHCSD
ncbi:casein kinase II subunit alpha-like [Homarus americanus]|uniref:Putative Lipopolysaccharide kinase (Kdo/WaaP) family-containing protein 2 n=1 Tax=Homarus americanus TaxID=6706 RepID=A0A8J5N4F9_HOMAM|nr:casein kinase II subunit alpha-like [Homarus americanus]KAG7172944.1 putative Lipopolysaccharide kinase (Kdo/WaaP) family-containing protein 2 [Homarus americanus]